MNDEVGGALERWISVRGNVMRARAVAQLAGREPPMMKKKKKEEGSKSFAMEWEM